MDSAPRSKKIINLFTYIELGIALLIPALILTFNLFNPAIIDFYISNEVASYFITLLLSGILILIMLLKVFLNLVMFRTTEKAFYSQNFKLLALITGTILVLYAASTIFSSDYKISIFGYYTNIYPNFFSWIGVSIVSLSIFINSYQKADVQRFINNAIFSFFSLFNIVVIVLLFLKILSVRENLSIDLVKDELDININLVIFISGINTLIALLKLISSSRDLVKFIALASLVLSSIVYILTSTFIAFIGMVLVLLCLIYITRFNIQKRNLVGVYFALFFFFNLITLVTDFNEFKKLENVLPVDESFNIAVQALRTNPITGAGPNTFLNSFWQYRSENFNNSEYFNVDFANPFSELILIVHDVGIIGFIFIIISAFLLIRNLLSFKAEDLNNPASDYFILLLFTFGALLVSSIGGFGFLLAAIFLGLMMNNSDDYYKQQNIINYATNTVVETIPPEENVNQSVSLFVNTLIIIVGISISLLLVQITQYSIKYISNEVRMNQTLRELESPNLTTGQMNNIVATQREIILDKNNVGGRADYANNFAATNIVLASYLIENSTQSDEIQQLIAQLIETAVVSTNKAVEVYPLSSLEWRTRASIYSSMSGFKGNAIEIAINSLIKAAQLSPNDPVIRFDLATLYILLEDDNNAIEQLKKAVRLKPNYIEARAILIRLYNKTGTLNDGVDDIKYFIENVSPDNPLYQQVLDIINFYKQQQEAE